jgi:SAM-dependent methyltransferase
MTTNELERRRWNDEYFASLWPKRERLTDQVTPYLLDALALRPGEHLLDVGCGGGKAAIEAARAVGPDGSVVGADVSAPLGRLATQRAAEAGVENVAFTVVDVQTDPVDGAPFDAAMSQFGVMFFDEPVTAFTNIRAQLEPGARLAFACWQSAESNPWLPFPVVASFVPPPPEPGPGKSPTGPFTLADPELTTGILESAGFVDVARTVHALDVEVPEDSVIDDAQLAFMGVTDDDLEAAQAVLDAHMQQFRLPSGLSRFALRFQLFRASNPG